MCLFNVLYSLHWCTALWPQEEVYNFRGLRASEFRDCLGTKLCHCPWYPFSQQHSHWENLVFIHYVDCLPKDQLCSLLREFWSHFFLSLIMRMEQHYQHTMSSFHELTFPIEPVPLASWRSPRSQRCVTCKDALGHPPLHLFLVNRGPFTQLDCGGFEE